MSFRTKIMLCTAVLIALAFGLGGTLLISLSFQNALDQQEERAVQSFQTVQSTLGLVNSVSSQTQEEDVVSVLRQMDTQSGGAWLALRITSEGEVLYQSTGAETSLLHSLWEEVSSEGGLLERFTDGEGHYLQIASPFLINEQTYCLEALYDSSEAYRDRDNQQRSYRQIFWLVVLAGAAVSWLVAGLLTRPLRRLSAASRALAEGNLSSRSRIQTGDEIGRLSRDFDRMADSMEDYIRRLQESMRHQEEFMGSFAHELKTPMTSIIGYADMLRGQSLTGEEVREAANYIFSEGVRLERLSLKLLDLLVLRKEDFRLVPVELIPFARQIKGMLEPVMRRHEITLRVYCRPGRCQMEPELAKSLVINLIDNARKAMDGPGEIILNMRPTEEGCLIQVADNGRGIPPEEIDKITEAFYRVDKSRSRAQGGAGLGLALCGEIVRIHHGTLQFESRPGAGTLVTAELKGGATA